MALDLIEEEDRKRKGIHMPGIPHLLRFDLESVVWCAAWIVVCFSEGKELHNTTADHPLENWFMGEYNVIVAIKTQYLTGPSQTKPYYESVEEGLWALLDVFAVAYFNRNQGRKAAIRAAKFGRSKASPVPDDSFQGIESLRDTLIEAEWVAPDAAIEVLQLCGLSSPNVEP